MTDTGDTCNGRELYHVSRRHPELGPRPRDPARADRHPRQEVDHGVVVVPDNMLGHVTVTLVTPDSPEHELRLLLVPAVPQLAGDAHPVPQVDVLLPAAGHRGTGPRHRQPGQHYHHHYHYNHHYHHCNNVHLVTRVRVPVVVAAWHWYSPASLA